MKLKDTLLYCLITIGCATSLMHANEIDPAFADFPIEQAEISTENYQTPDFDGRDSWAAMMKTRLTNAALKGPNFAGHYQIVLVGCGSSCDIGYVIDVANGEVFEFPFGGEANSRMTLEYQLDSRLVTTTFPAETPGKCIEKSIVFEGRGFTEIGSRAFDGDYFCE